MIKMSVGKVLLFRARSSVEKRDEIVSTLVSNNIETRDIQASCSLLLQYELVNFAGGDIKVFLENQDTNRVVVQEVKNIHGNKHP